MKNNILLLFIFITISAVWVHASPSAYDLLSEFETQRVQVPDTSLDKYQYEYTIPFIQVHNRIAPVNTIDHPGLVAVIKNYFYLNRTTKPYRLELTQVVFEPGFDDQKNLILYPFIFLQRLFAVDFMSPVWVDQSIRLTTHTQFLQQKKLSYDKNNPLTSQIMSLLLNNFELNFLVSIFKNNWVDKNPTVAPAA